MGAGGLNRSGDYQGTLEVFFQSLLEDFPEVEAESKNDPSNFFFVYPRFLLFNQEFNRDAGFYVHWLPNVRYTNDATAKFSMSMVVIMVIVMAIMVILSYMDLKIHEGNAGVKQTNKKVEFAKTRQMLI